MRVDVCILGGGIAGLAAAHRLSQDRVSYIILEKAPQLGGLLTSADLGGAKVERFYHHIFTHDHHTLSLCGTLDIQDRLTWHTTRIGMILGEKLFEISNPLKFILTGPFRLSDRVALVQAMQKIACIPTASDFDNQSAEAFLNGLCGTKLTRDLFLPLLKAKFGMDPDNTSAAFLIGRVKARFKTRNRLALRERLGYLRGGYATLLHAVTRAIATAGGKWETSARIVSVERVGSAFRILWERNGTSQEVWADVVINTLPIPIFLRVAKNPPPRYAVDLENIRYQGVLVLLLAVDHSIAPYYWTTVVREDVPFSTLVEHTRFQSPRFYGDKHVLYMSRYLSKTDVYWKLSDGEILRSFLEGLARVFPDARHAVVKDWKVSREEFATPVFEKKFLHKIPQQKTPWDGLFNAGSVHVYPDSRNINNVIASGTTAARLAMESLRNRATTPVEFVHKGGLG